MENKELLFERVHDALKLCEPEDSQFSAVMLVVNNETGSVKIFGLNIDELDVPVLLAEAAAEVGERITGEYENRMLN
jgi:hypothetical protein